MIRTRKLLGILLVIALMLAMVAGCAGEQTPSTPTTGAGGTAPTDSGGGNNSTDGSTEDPIKVGGLYDMTGDASVIALQKYYAAQFAIDEINANGGLLGRQVELIAPDCQSDTARHQEMARKLILEDEVDVIHGCMFSACREAVRPIMEENEMLYFYNNQYEGGVASKWTFCTGSQPEQQIKPMMEYMIDKYGSNYYYIGADYNFGWGSAKWCEYVANELGATNVGTEFVPLDVGEFSSSIEKIRQSGADFVMVCLTGVTQNSFFPQWQSSGMTTPLCSTFLMAQSYDHLRFEAPALSGMYTIASYMEELDTDGAKDFNARIKAAYPALEYVGMEAEAEYTGIMLWAEAVKRAGTVERHAVLEELEKGITLENMPCGTVILDGATHTTTKDFWIAHADDDHNIIFDEYFEQVPAYWLSEFMKIDLREEWPNEQYNADGSKAS